MAQARKNPSRKPVPAPVDEPEMLIPEGHSFIKDEALESLIAGQREASAAQRATEERWSNADKVRAAQTDSMFSGLQVATRSMGDEIARLTMRNVDQDKKLLEYQTLVHEKNQEISDMTRQSEEARLKREEQAAQLKHKELDLQQRAMELNAEKEKFRATLQMVSPLVMAGGMGLKDWLADKMASKGGPVGAAVAAAMPGGAVPDNGSEQTSGQGPQFRVTLDCIEEWRQFVTIAFKNAKPETVAVLRALVAGGFSGPGGPKMPVEAVVNALRADLGDEAMFGFMRLTGMAWAEETSEMPPPRPAPQAN